MSECNIKYMANEISNGGLRRTQRGNTAREKTTRESQENGYPRKTEEEEEKTNEEKKLVNTDGRRGEKEGKHLLNHEVQPEYQESSHVSAHITQGPMGAEGETGASEPSSKGQSTRSVPAEQFPEEPAEHQSARTGEEP